MAREDRLEILRRILALVGTDAASVVDAARGWPASVIIRVSDGPVPVAAHVGPLQKSHRGRDAVERRFQNPGQGKPVQSPAGMLPILLGLWDEPPQRPVLVAMDAFRRVGRETRQSLFISLELLVEAATKGWADRVSGSGERIFAFHPKLLPAYVEMVRRGVVSEFPSDHMVDVVDASGLLGPEDETPAERARRVSVSLSRDAAFARDVVSAYRGLCALCGIDFGLVQGAHILPVHAPGSPDKVWNGVALCSNHHVAFDRHALWIDPQSRRVTLRDDLHRNATINSACHAFVATTFEQLTEPTKADQRPHEKMFQRRYELYSDQYEWALRQ